jgi:hypothetical protein
MRSVGCPAVEVRLLGAVQSRARRRLGTQVLRGLWREGRCGRAPPDAHTSRRKAMTAGRSASRTPGRPVGVSSFNPRYPTRPEARTRPAESSPSPQLEPWTRAKGAPPGHSTPVSFEARLSLPRVPRTSLSSRASRAATWTRQRCAALREGADEGGAAGVALPRLAAHVRVAHDQPRLTHRRPGVDGSRRNQDDDAGPASQVARRRRRPARRGLCAATRRRG